jgi:DNA-binding LacI/PurR family transcriptional regulator
MSPSVKNATIRDVARLAGVSVATVSRYINQAAVVTDATALKVQAAMEELQFSPHPVARNLATHRTNAIGLVLNDIGGDFFTPLLEGVLNATSANGYNLLIFTANQPQRSNHAMLNSQYTDGLLVFLDSVEAGELEKIRDTGHPVVLIHQSSPANLEIPTVTIENKAASFQIVSHLITEHHRRRIVFLRGPQDNEDSAWREAGYRKALETHGLPFDESFISAGGFDRFIARDSIRELLQKKVKFDGVFAGDDEAAIGVLQALRESNIAVPSQVSVVGFDDQRLAPFLDPPLTTVHAPTDQVGTLAAQQLIKLIHGEPVDKVMLLTTTLVFRRSCGCDGKEVRE